MIVSSLILFGLGLRLVLVWVAFTVWFTMVLLVTCVLGCLAGFCC